MSRPPSPTASHSNVPTNEESVAPPTTPPKGKATPHSELHLATLHSQGSASASKDMVDYQVSDVAPHLREDMRRTDTVLFKDFILVLVANLYPGDASVVLGHIMRHMAHIANGKIPATRNESDRLVMERNVPRISSALREYCSPVSHEGKRYALFVTTCNAALAVLALVDVDEIQHLNPTDIMFQRQDPTTIEGKHFMGNSNRRKPDIIGLSRAELEERHAPKPGRQLSIMRPTDQDELDVLATQPIKIPIPWELILNCVEFKKILGELDDVLKVLERCRYTARVAEDYMEKHNQSMNDHSIASTSQAGSSNKGSHKRKQPHTPSAEPASKSPKIGRKAHPVIQTFGYGAEQLNAAFARAHAMNLLVTGTSLLFVAFLDHNFDSQVRQHDVSLVFR
ncbi:hypothetical protein AAF712_015716 [Marasmius tenuissimus]|uniref:Uncharacterized protein n=1 Tax=Marasmius tenuissimus TaxID=585030 RepID=A0ABR2ZA22_9AGAR